MSICIWLHPQPPPPQKKSPAFPAQNINEVNLDTGASKAWIFPRFLYKQELNLVVCPMKIYHTSSLDCNVVLSLGEIGREMRVNQGGRRRGGVLVPRHLISHHDHQDRWTHAERIRTTLATSFTSMSQC